MEMEHKFLCLVTDEKRATDYFKQTAVTREKKTHTWLSLGDLWK